MCVCQSHNGLCLTKIANNLRTVLVLENVIGITVSFPQQLYFYWCTIHKVARSGTIQVCVHSTAISLSLASLKYSINQQSTVMCRSSEHITCGLIKYELYCPLINCLLSHCDKWLINDLGYEFCRWRSDWLLDFSIYNIERFCATNKIK